MSSDLAVEVTQLSKTYHLFNKPSDRFMQGLWGKRRQYFHEVQALKDVSLSIKRGDTVGIIGKNGSGKSTLLQIICGTVQPTSGACQVYGRISALLELGAGFNPEFTGKENVYLNAAILGMTLEEVTEKYPAIEAFAGIGEMINQPVKTYSSGMYVRLAFAVAIASEPDILIVDEALAVGDEAFQRKCFARIRAIQERGGTILFVSHSANTIVEVCDHAVLLDQGELLFSGRPKEVISHYHKLLYAPEDKVPALRQALKETMQGHTLHLTEEKSENPAEKKHESLFDPSLVPESLISFEPHGARISNVRITTEEGRDVNLLNRGERYIYQYDVQFDEDACGIQCGMMIKTKSGVLLGGSFYKNEKERWIMKGVCWQVTFSFVCQLLPGTYFTNAGCSALKENERVFLHRITDALMFKVQPEENLMLTGMIDFTMSADIVDISQEVKVCKST